MFSCDIVEQVEQADAVLASFRTPWELSVPIFHEAGASACPPRWRSHRADGAQGERRRPPLAGSAEGDARMDLGLVNARTGAR